MDEPRRLILADSSAWIEYLRGTGSETAQQVHDLGPPGLAITEPVAMELLAGAHEPTQLGALRAIIGSTKQLAVAGSEDYERAAAIQRRCRSLEAAVRSIVDCLIAAVAIRNEVPILHRDRDFDLIARHTPLQIAA